MNKIEKAPDWLKKEFIKKAIDLRFQKNLDNLINHINDHYFYWDKVKYQKTEGKTEPELLWTLTKLSRALNAKKVNFGKFEFKFNLTDTIQKGLHEFDMHIGGNLGAKSAIPEEDKKRYPISSVKEIENRFSISNQTAQTDLMELANKGYLEEIDLNKRTKGL